MTILEEIIKYSKECISGKIISGQKHIWACQRFLNDVKAAKKKSYPYYWSEEEAEKIVKWFSYLRHSKGVLANKPIILTSWQKFRICQLYGWRRKENGRKRFTHCFVMVARKNAKSQEEAGIALYEMSTQAIKNGEVYELYTAGVKKEQSQIIADEAALMLRGSVLESKFKVFRYQGKAYAILHKKSGSRLKALSSEDGRKGDGTNPAVLILDEYHQHPTTEFYSLFMGANTKESLLMIITTAGTDLTFPCYTREYDLCSNILNPNIDMDNDTYLIDICEVDKGDDITNRENWKKANPIRMTYDKGIEKIEEEFKLAKGKPEDMPMFMTKCLNMWVQAKENGYMDMDKWKKCEVKELPVSLDGLFVYVGFDMSAKIDLTSVAFVIPVKIDDVVKYIVFSHSFIPNMEKLRERIIKDKVPYDAWAMNGYLSLTNTEIVDQQQVMDYVIETCNKNNWKIHTLCFDPNNASKIMTDLDGEGYNVEEIWQSHRQLNDATAGFREQVYEGNVIYLKNPLLNYAMGNAVTVSRGGFIKIDKDKSTKRIDPVDALLCAYKLAMFHDFDPINLNDIVDEFLENF